jgi:hypothetical protein
MPETERVMRDLLLGGGFAFDDPDPRRGWEAFKVFVRTSLPGLETYTVGYECLHVDDRDDVLWLSFVRRFHPDTGVPDCGCVFSRAVPVKLWAVNDFNWWWPEHGTLAEWFSEVERMRTFGVCTGMAGWRWEGFAG